MEAPALTPAHTALAYAEKRAYNDLLHAVQMQPELAHQTDAFAMTPLHWICSDRLVPLRVLQHVVVAFPGATAARNLAGLLPLHLAIRKDMSLHALKTLLKFHPSAILVPTPDGLSVLDLAQEYITSRSTKIFLHMLEQEVRSLSRVATASSSPSPSVPLQHHREEEEGGAVAPLTSSTQLDALDARPPEWRLRKSCHECAAKFRYFRARHHCRNCGESVCSRHSKHMLPLPHLGLLKPQRICNSCHGRLHAHYSAHALSKLGHELGERGTTFEDTLPAEFAQSPRPPPPHHAQAMTVTKSMPQFDAEEEVAFHGDGYWPRTRPSPRQQMLAHQRAMRSPPPSPPSPRGQRHADTIQFVGMAPDMDHDSNVLDKLDKLALVPSSTTTLTVMAMSPKVIRTPSVVSIQSAQRKPSSTTTMGPASHNAKAVDAPKTRTTRGNSTATQAPISSQQRLRRERLARTDLETYTYSLPSGFEARHRPMDMDVEMKHVAFAQQQQEQPQHRPREETSVAGGRSVAERAQREKDMCDEILREYEGRAYESYVTARSRMEEEDEEEEEEEEEGSHLDLDDDSVRVDNYHDLSDGEDTQTEGGLTTDESESDCSFGSNTAPSLRFCGGSYQLDHDTHRALLTDARLVVRDDDVDIDDDEGSEQTAAASVGEESQLAASDTCFESSEYGTDSDLDSASWVYSIVPETTPTSTALEVSRPAPAQTQTQALSPFGHEPSIQDMPLDRAATQHELGIVLLSKADFERATEELKHALALNPGNALAWYHLAKAMDGTGDAIGAERAIQRSLALEGASLPSLSLLGKLLNARGEHDEAIAVFRRALSLQGPVHRKPEQGEEDPAEPWGSL